MGETTEAYEAWTRPWRVVGWLLLAAWVVAMVGAKPVPVPRQEAMDEDLFGLPVTVWEFDAPWRVETWALVLAGVVFVVTLGVLVRGPQPLRMTRTAWVFPIVLVPVLAVPAYLLFGGPARVGGVPGSPERWPWYFGATVALFLEWATSALVARF